MEIAKLGRWFLGCIVLAAVTLSARAHDPGLSTAQGGINARVIELITGFAPADAEALLPLELRQDSRRSVEEFAAIKAEWARVALQLWEVRADGAVVEPREGKAELLADDNVSFRVVWPRPAGTRLQLRATKIPVLPAGHRQFVIITDGRGMMIAKKLLSARDSGLEVDVAAAAAGGAGEAPPAVAPTNWGFVRLGIEHIWTGYDHLLFLFALLIVCRTFRSMVGIVSCFTLAHSLTLALATLEVVNLPSRWVEPAIAASIVFVGLENLWRRGEEPRGRWALTFAFGLIHGFGFASVLRELGVGSGGEGIGMPLFTFNAGVEIGQIVIAALVLPVVFWLRKKPWFAKRGVPALSVVVALAGLYWLLERTVFA